MKSQTLLFLRTVALAIGISAIAACGGSDATNTNAPTVTPSNDPAASSSNTNAPATPTTTTANANQPAPPAGTTNCPDCYVHVFDDKGFDTTDDNHMICGPGKWPNLRNLAGAVKPVWGDEIESLRVGPKATVIVWTEENYTGTSQTFGPGSAITSLKASNPGLSDNISSIEIRCQ